MPKIIDDIKKYNAQINKKSGNKPNSRNKDEDDDEDDFTIRNTNNAIIIGASSHGNIALDRRKFEIGGTRCLTIGTTGSGKSFTTRNIIEQLYYNKTGVIVILDPEGEYYTLRSKFDFVILGLEQENCDIVINEENAADLTFKMIVNGIHLIVDLSDADDDKIRQEIATLIIQTILKYRKISPSIQLIVEEAAIFAKKSLGTTSIQNIKCTDALKKIARLGRKGAVCTFFSTQRITHLHKDISAECNTYIIGKCNDPADIERNASFLHLKGKDIPDFENLKHEFYAYGEGFDHYDQKNKPIKFKSNTPYSKHNDTSRRLPNSFPKPATETVIKWIGLMQSIKEHVIQGMAAVKEEKQLSLIDSSSFIGNTTKKETKEIKEKKDWRDEDLPMPLSDSCEICGKASALAYGRCEKCADFESQINNDDFDDFDDDDNDDEENDDD